jgi:hypothetical protein
LQLRLLSQKGLLIYTQLIAPGRAQINHNDQIQNSKQPDIHVVDSRPTWFILILPGILSMLIKNNSEIANLGILELKVFCPSNP